MAVTSRAAHRPIGYRTVLAAPGVSRSLGGTLLGRLPAAMAPLGILIALAPHGLERAGALSGVQMLAASLGQPLLARAADRHGTRLVLSVSTAATSAEFAALAVGDARPQILTTGLIALSGLTAPPLQSTLRARWPRLLAAAAQPTAQALDAASTELLYVLAPLLAAALALHSPRALFAAAALLGAAGTAVILADRDDAVPEPARARPGGGALGHAALRRLIPVHLAVGAALGAVPVAAAHTGHPALPGQASAVLFGASAVGGVFYGLVAHRGSAPAHLSIAALGLSAGLAVFALSSGTLATLVAALATGLFLAPLLACGALLGQRAVPGEVRAEAAGWLIGALGIGEGAATPLAASGLLPAALWPALIGGGVLALALAYRARARERAHPVLAAAPEPVPAPVRTLTGASR